MTVEIIDGKVIGYLSLEELSDKLGIKYQMIYQKIRRGQLETLQIGKQHFIKEGTEITISRKIKVSC